MPAYLQAMKGQCGPGEILGENQAFGEQSLAGFCSTSFFCTHRAFGASGHVHQGTTDGLNFPPEGMCGSCTLTMKAKVKVLERMIGVTIS